MAFEQRLAHDRVKTTIHQVLTTGGGDQRELRHPGRHGGAAHGVHRPVRDVVEIEPAGYMYFVYADEIIIVEPRTLEIVAVLQV